jgi:hypothetical protein
MTTNQDAYQRLAAASQDAADASDAATSAAAQDRLQEISRGFDDELAAMIARDLMKSTASYTPLTAQLKDLKAEIDEVVKNTQQFVAGADLVAKVAASFSRMLLLL